ncbi:hypothetical protein Celaphus_00015812, partial [Cervus elaphus hippelaphus]
MRREAAESPVARPPPKREMQFSVTGPDGRRGRDAPAQWAKAAFCSSCRFSVRSDLELALRSVEALNVPQLPELLKLYYQKLFPNARGYLRSLSLLHQPERSGKDDVDKCSKCWALMTLAICTIDRALKDLSIVSGCILQGELPKSQSLEDWEPLKKVAGRCQNNIENDKCGLWLNVLIDLQKVDQFTVSTISSICYERDTVSTSEEEKKNIKDCVQKANALDCGLYVVEGEKGKVLHIQEILLKASILPLPIKHFEFLPRLVRNYLIDEFWIQNYKMECTVINKLLA